MHRNSLRTAMSLLKEMSERETELLQDDTSAATFKETGKLGGENDCTSSQKNVIEATMINKGRTTLKKGKGLRTAENSKCLKTSNSPKAQKQVQATDMSDRRKRKCMEDPSREQARFRGRKKASPKTVSPNRSPAEKHMSEKGKNMLPGSNEENTRKRNQPSKMDSVQVTTTLQQVASDTDEKDSPRKSRYQLPLPDFSFTETEFFSSELSMESSSPESSTIPEVWPNYDTEEDTQLPVIELKKEPVSFERGAFVWCKFQRYPYWPSWIKLVHNKEKRASIIFLEESLSDPNSQKQSFPVSFRTLKHYDCLEKQELLEIASKDYGKSVHWCDALICDYRIRLGCGSFSGSFLEYCTSAISYPVRKECCKTKLDFPSICPEFREIVPDSDNDSVVKMKILPDRARASRDRANEKLVECIVNSKQSEHHLMAILAGKKKSHYLTKFQLSKQNMECLETYIEDEEQVELVVGYMRNLCKNMSKQSKKLMNGDETKFIFEVLIPEAVIFAISATEGINYEKAEKKFLKGPLHSKRERKLFEKKILDKKRIRPEEHL